MSEEKVDITKRPLLSCYCEALRTIKNPELDGVNPHFKSKFSTLKMVLSVISKACEPLDISYSQRIYDGAIHTFIMDKDGEEYLLSYYPIIEDANPQKVGSFITYMRRYLALTDFGIVGDPDDDGNNAAGNASDPKIKSAVHDAKGGEQSKRNAYLKRVEELQQQAISKGIKADGITGYVNAKYSKPWSELSCDELHEIGVYITGLINDKESLNG